MKCPQILWEKTSSQKVYCYCPQYLPSADKYPQILIEVPAEGICPHIMVLSTCKK